MPKRIEPAKLSEYIRQRIKQRREELGLSMYAVCNNSQKINNKTAYRILTHGYDCHVSTLEQILDALGLEIRIVEKKDETKD